MYYNTSNSSDLNNSINDMHDETYSIPTVGVQTIDITKENDDVIFASLNVHSKTLQENVTFFKKIVFRSKNLQASTLGPNKKLDTHNSLCSK